MTKVNSRPDTNGAATTDISTSAARLPSTTDTPRALVHVGARLGARVTSPGTILACPATACGHLHHVRIGDLEALAAGHLSRACPATGQRYLLVDAESESRRD